MLLDALGTRYHKLPSEVLRRSDTLDILIFDVAVTWQRNQEELAQAKAEGKPAPAKLSVEQMKEMIARVKK